ncbi:MAG: sugar phosphate isomerase/epimerase family protein [bacterium]
MMKIGYRTASFGDSPLENTLDILAEAGCQGVELCFEQVELNPLDIVKSGPERIKSLLDSKGLEIASVSLHTDFVNDPRNYCGLMDAIGAAQQLCCGILIVSSGRLDRGAKDRQMSALKCRLEGLLRAAEGEDICLAIEPEPDLILESTEDALKLLEDMKSPTLKVNFDVGHAHCTDPNVLKSIRDLGPNIVHVHLEDIRGKVHRHLIPGEGEINLPAVIDALNSIGFDGYCTIDLFDVEDPVAAARESIARVEKLLE